MKAADPAFSVGEFLSGARAAYEMILMAFERGDLAPVKAFLAPEVYDAMARVVEERARKGLKVESTFVGISDLGAHATRPSTARAARPRSPCASPAR